MKRRDLLEASRLVKKHKLVPTGDVDPAALMLGVQYLQAKREGETDKTFPEWLDEDTGDDEDNEDNEGEEGELPPTETTPT